MQKLWLLSWPPSLEANDQMNRHLSRTIAMQSIFEAEFRPGADLSGIIERNIAAYKEDADADYIRTTVNGAMSKRATIDEAIAKVAPEWPVDQIASIDKAILRLAIYELLYNPEVPPKVAINEAVELSKTFGSDSTPRFVNGVLGTIYRESDRYNPADDLLAGKQNEIENNKSESGDEIIELKEDQPIHFD